MSVAPYRGGYRRGVGSIVNRLGELKWLADTMTRPYQRALRSRYGNGSRPSGAVRGAVRKIASKVRSGVKRQRTGGKTIVKRVFPGRPRERIRRKSFYTMGRYVGAVKGPRNFRGKDLFRTMGSSTKVEVQGSTVGADTAEIGHSVCVPQLIMQSVGRAIHRRLWKMLGGNITDWTVTDGDIAEANITYFITYRTDYTSATITSTTPAAFVTGDTHSQMADKVMDAILALYTTTNDNLIVEEVVYRQASGTNLPIKKLPVRQSHVVLSVLSLMTLQNITESASGGTDDHTHVTDVRANPVVGRVFQSRSNSFVPVGGVADGFTANIATSRHGQIGDVTGNMTHPKAPNFYQNAARSGQVIIQPGQIKKSKLSCYKKVGFNQMMRLFRRWVIVNTAVTGVASDVYVGFGPSRMYHFEHMVKNSGDPSVTLGYELNIFVKSYIMAHAKREALRIEE